MLEFENDVLLNTVLENQLNIFASGIPLDLVLTKLFQTYASDRHLVFVLSSNGGEDEYFKKKLEGEKILSVTTEFSAAERKKLYGSGGVFFATSRILVVDFLKDVIPAEKITGIIVLKAHNVVETSQEAFILRLYRSKNKTGFIKAFSQSPQSFLLGFSKLNRVMRCCFLANVSLWPRFHSSIIQSLARAPPDGVEIQLRMSEEMEEIQTNLLDLVNWSISELKRIIPALNDDDVTPEIALTKGFEKIVAAYVDPVWNTISAKSKEILNDIKIFRLLLTQLTKSDCVTFFSVLCSYTSKDAVFKSSWVLTKAAEHIITASKARLFPALHSKKVADGKPLIFKPETHPKWLAVSEILQEISNMTQTDSKDHFAAKLKTLIFTEDMRTCTVLKDYLCYGGEATMAKIAQNCEKIKVELSTDLSQKLENIYHEKDGVKKYRIGGEQRRRGTKEIEEDCSNNTFGPTEVQVTLTQIERKYEEIEFLQAPVFVRPVKNLGEFEVFAVTETLQKLRPDVILIFDPSLTLLRSIEVHRARVADIQEVKVYFFSFHNSVEEQIYLTAMQREKRAFEVLVEEKDKMVVPNEREGKDDLNQDLARDPTKANETVSFGGHSKRNMQTNNTRQLVLVDMREFRSELPSLIHKRGIELEPLTLDVGDYILTPDICVERKSISDLVGSLNSGRLYKQVEAMTRHYKRPVVLIEHENQAQSLASGSKYRNDLVQIMPKLQLLTMHFPRLKLIWSPGAHYTSELFHELKRGKEQPDIESALSIQKESTGIHATSKYNIISHNFLSKMPGIDSRNVYSLLANCDSIDAISKLNESDLSKMLENSHSGSILYAAIHSNLLSESKQGGADHKKASKPIPSFKVSGIGKRGTKR